MFDRVGFPEYYLENIALLQSVVTIALILHDVHIIINR